MWEKVLSPGEEIKYEFGMGKNYLIIRTIFITILGILLLPIGGFFIILLGLFSYWYLGIANKFAFTNKRVLIHHGWLSTNLISIDYDKITDVVVYEPFLKRVIYGIGDLSIRTASTEHAILDRVDKPYEVKKTLDSLKGNKTN